MGSMSWLLWDCILVFAAIWIVAKNVQKGFVRSLIQLVGTAVAIVVASFAASLLAEVIYSSLIRQPILDMLGQIRGNPTADMIAHGLRYIPEILVSLLMAFYGDSLAAQIAGAYAEQGRNAATYVADQMMKPVVNAVLSLILFLLLFTLLMIVVHLVSKMMQSVNNIPVLGVCNQILGGVMGVLMAYLSLSVAVSVIDSLVTMFQVDNVLLNRDILNRTYVYRALTIFNPVNILMSIKM